MNCNKTEVFCVIINRLTLQTDIRDVQTADTGIIAAMGSITIQGYLLLNVPFYLIGALNRIFEPYLKEGIVSPSGEWNS